MLSGITSSMERMSKQMADMQRVIDRQAGLLAKPKQQLAKNKGNQAGVKAPDMDYD